VALVVLVALALLTVATATAPAGGNRDPLSSLAATPGPATVTNGGVVALTASLVNRQSSTFTDVRFSLPIPPGVTFQSTDCATFEILSTQTGQVFVCKWGHQLRAGKTAAVVIALRTPDTGSSATFAGKWVIKEGQQWKGGGKDTFPTNAVTVQLLAQNDPQKAATFATSTCTDPSTPTLATPPIGPGNPLATSVCAPSLPTVPITGIAAAIDERDRTNTDPGITQVSDICLPEPTSQCGPTLTPFVFSPPATFTFTIDNAALPRVCSKHRTSSGSSIATGGRTCTVPQIKKVFHDGVLVPPTSTDPKIVSITFNKWKKTTTVVVTSSTNGWWNFG
jgi:hypothetical protein